MNKKGFISMTLVYTFLILFLFLTLAILNTYSNKNKFLDAIDDKINDDINSFSNSNNNLLNKLLIDNTPTLDSNILFHKISNLSVGNGNGLFYTDDKNKTDLNNDGVGNRIYYFRGEVDNNYLLFGGFCWKIIRTNENGSIRVRYDGLFENGTCPTTGTRVYINTSSYNLNNTTEDNMKFINSNIKDILDEWYLTNISTIDASLLVSDEIFCNNTTISETENTKKYYHSKSLIPKIIDSDDSDEENTFIENLSFVCTNQDDRYTLIDGSDFSSNRVLDYPIGLLTMEDVMFAGGVYDIPNKKHYLNTGNDYWTMTPYSFDTEGNNIYIKSDGSISNASNSSNFDIIPVISISSSALVSSGNGKYDNPYIIR